MLDEIKLVLEDFKHRRTIVEAEVKKTDNSIQRQDVLANMFSSGAQEALNYTIKVLESVVDNHSVKH